MAMVVPSLWGAIEMSANDLRGLLRRSPFQPFRLFLSSGNSYDVAGPEWMMVTSGTTALGIPGRAGDGDQVLLLDNYHITHIEPIPAATSAA